VLPEGSSVFRRLERGELTLEELGLKKYPKAGERLEKPMLDVSTKLESEDRYLSWEEAMQISGLSKEEANAIKETTMRINEAITNETLKAGIVNEDGKIEFAFDADRNLIVVDSVGTPDECRFSFDGMEISKEVLRRYYRTTKWYELLKQVRGRENWRKTVGIPPKLPAELKKTVSDMYKACCNEIVGRKLFDVDSLKSVVKRLKYEGSVGN
jgi:phosphoribosylaminoimidazole-succinocarboxamide synthase